MSLSAVGERYARALFELAEEKGQVEPMTSQLVSIADAYRGSDQLQSVLDNPLVAEQKQDAILDALARRLTLGPEVVKLLRLLARRRRMAALPDVARALRKMADRKTGVLRATVRSATPLTDTDLRQLAAQLEKTTRRKVVIEKQHDPSLVAGIVTRIGDKTIDGSLQGRLEAIQHRLLSS